jgi:hypothetical protein
MRAIRELTAVLALFATGAAAAAGLGGLKASSPGIGLEVSSGVLEPFGRRAWITATRHDVEEAGVRYDDSFRYGTGFLLALASGDRFRLSGGLAYNHQRTEVIAVRAARRSVSAAVTRWPCSGRSTIGCVTRSRAFIWDGLGIAPSRKSGSTSADLASYQRPAHHSSAAARR